MMWLTFHSAFHDLGKSSLFCDGLSLDPENVVTHCSEERRASLIRASGVRHAKYHSFAELLAVVACREARADVPLQDEDVGVVATGGPTHTPLAWDFTRTIQQQGVKLVNPMYFPHILQSSVGCTVAAECGARAFAVTVGHGCGAFFESLTAAYDLIGSGFAKAVLIPSVNDGGLQNQMFQERAKRSGLPADIGICCVLTSVRPKAGAIIGLEKCMTSIPSNDHGSGSDHTFRIDIVGETGLEMYYGGGASTSSRWLNMQVAYAATGAVLTAEIISCIDRNSATALTMRAQWNSKAVDISLHIGIDRRGTSVLK